MSAWYVVGWISMLGIPVDLAIANNAEAAIWQRLTFTALMLAHGSIALCAFRKRPILEGEKP